jgi:hypothetical protein
MRFLSTIPALLLPALQLPAGTIDPSLFNVSNANTQWLNPEDALRFTISEWNYEVNAAQRGLSPYPTQVSFQFAAAPQTDTGAFTAVLESSDGSVSLDFPGTLSWRQERMENSGYTGEVSVLYGLMDLSANLSEELFTNPAAVLVLETRAETWMPDCHPIRSGKT